jgi:hypothetical protein
VIHRVWFCSKAHSFVCFFYFGYVNFIFENIPRDWSRSRDPLSFELGELTESDGGRGSVGGEATWGRAVTVVELWVVRVVAHDGLLSAAPMVELGFEVLVEGGGRGIRRRRHRGGQGRRGTDDGW